MSEIRKVLVLGSGDYAQKIAAFFSRDVLLTVQTSDCSTGPFEPDLVVEAISAGIPARRMTLLNVGLAAHTILATTVAGGITELAAGTGCEARVVGLNFIFNPVEDRVLVQTVKGLETSSETMEACRAVVSQAGAVVVVVEDVTGLIVGRVMASVINEAAYMLQTRLASMEDINRVPKLCLNWPMGPFEFADHIGIDNIVATLEAASKDSPQYLPCRLLREMVSAGRCGKKTGRGF